MNLSQALFLGLVQGLTEFLPVSSSGHLVLLQNLMGLQEPEMLFDVAVHAGTLAAVLLFFRRDIGDMILGLISSRPEGQRGRRLIWLVLAGSVPTAVIGLLFRHQFEALFSNILAVGCALLLTGFLLFFTARVKPPRRNLERTGPGRAALIGLAQGLAITPGISRSGATISTAIFLGVERPLAAHFSFLLSIPAILGALALQLKDLPPDGGPGWAVLVAGALTAAVSGYLALALLIRVVTQGRLFWFAPYCWLAGLLAIGWSLWR
ncbi:MAG: undecaprenyl-diphosphate phosphatase [Deltaproteobacteria bacterium]|nr:undecaprenyl-diphosphate phosphatase [Deltaproteobacteria bacterium]